mmetsp:Transcript_29938/g.73666  ORF Transcript_29938/g.73666 Transcript_29938/m.73666 type:complete len:261 (+) Transcript_29938:1117-1899(+)
MVPGDVREADGHGLAAELGLVLEEMRPPRVQAHLHVVCKPLLADAVHELRELRVAQLLVQLGQEIALLRQLEAHSQVIPVLAVDRRVVEVDEGSVLAPLRGRRGRAAGGLGGHLVEEALAALQLVLQHAGSRLQLRRHPPGRLLGEGPGPGGQCKCPRRRRASLLRRFLGRHGRERGLAAGRLPSWQGEWLARPWRRAPGRRHAPTQRHVPPSHARRHVRRGARDLLPREPPGQPSTPILKGDAPPGAPRVAQGKGQQEE